MMLVPLALLLAGFALWSAYWWVAATAAEARLAEVRDRAAAQGRAIACAGESFGGYPFRVEWRCNGPEITLDGPDGATTIALRGLVAVALAYNPTHVIVELSAPAVVTAAWPVPHRLELDWPTATASLRVGADGIRRADLRIDRLAARLTPDGGQIWGSASMDAFEAHARRQDPDRPAGSLDVALRMTGASLLRRGIEATQPADIAVLATIAESSRLDPADIEGSLPGWRDAGGTIEVGQMTMRQGGALYDGEGRLGLDVLGRPEGALTLRVAGEGAEPGGAMAMLAAGLGALGEPSEIDGQPATQVTLTLADGVLRLGPLGLAVLPVLAD